MLSLYEILKASKTGIAPDLWTALAGKNWGGSDSGHEIKELTGIPPLSFRADGTPLLDFLISGNMVQSGTPSPSSIIMPSECGDKTGNLFDGQFPNLNYQIQYLPLNIGDGQFTASTTTPRIGTSASLWILEGNVSSGAALSNSLYEGQSRTVSSVDGYITIAYRITSEAGTEVKPSDYTTMLNTGSTALPYEPYGQYKIPISSGGTTTPVYLGEVQSTRAIYKHELTGQETWMRTSTGKMYSSNALDGLPNYKHAYAITTMCSHYKSVSNAGNTGGVNLNEICLYGNPNIESTKEIYVYPENYATAADFATYLQQQYSAGTPVCVWYVLATPTTGIVNEPIRKIGDYTDTLSMEQAGVSIPTLNGQTVVDVDTTLKPSEVYIKYQG